MSTRKDYFVGIVYWASYKAWVTADSEEAAKAEAERLFIENRDSFKHSDSGIDLIEILDEEDADDQPDVQQCPDQGGAA
jgi:hypothetical protein